MYKRQVEGGIVALFAFILFTIGYITTWLKVPYRLGLALLTLIFPILLHSQLEFPFYSSVSHWLVFLIMLWLVDRYTLADNAESTFIACPQTFLIRFVALFIPTIFVPFLLTSLHTAHILVAHEKNPTNPKAFERLSNIVNPIAWLGRLDAAVYSHTLIKGLNDKDVNKLEKYLTWALKRLKHTPRESLYENSLLVLKILGRNEAYKLLLEEAEITFPQHLNWHSSILQENKSNGFNK